MHTGGLQAVSSKVKARGHFRTFAKRQGLKERVRLELTLSALGRAAMGASQWRDGHMQPKY